MSLISKPNTFSAGTIIVASEHNANFDIIYSDYNGNITNANISGSASIAYSKLNLTGGIVNSDLSASAGIVATKIDLTSANPIGSVSPNTGAFTTLKVGTTNQGDILYDNGTSLVRLVPGTSGQFLKTQGASANPVWDSPGSSNLEYSGLSTLTATTGNMVYVNWQISKLKKISSVSTLTWYGYVSANASALDVYIKVDVGGLNSVAHSTANSGWLTNTINISSLNAGTVYDLVVSTTKAPDSGTAYTVGGSTGGAIIFGS